MCEPGDQTCLDALFDGNESWSLCEKDKRFTICCRYVQGKWNCRYSRHLPKSIPKARLCSWNNENVVAGIRLFEGELRKISRAGKIVSSSFHFQDLKFVRFTSKKTSYAIFNLPSFNSYSLCRRLGRRYDLSGSFCNTSS